MGWESEKAGDIPAASCIASAKPFRNEDSVYYGAYQNKHSRFLPLPSLMAPSVT
jgi:hypothetical protein